MFCSCVLIFVYCDYDTDFAYYFVMCFYSEINLCLNLSGRLINVLIKASGPKALFGEMKKSVNNVAELFFHIQDNILLHNIKVSELKGMLLMNIIKATITFLPNVFSKTIQQCNIYVFAPVVGVKNTLDLNYYSTLFGN